MSTLAVTTVTTANGTTNLILNTGNTSGPDIVLVATDTIQMGGNSSTNTFQISANGHAVFANTTANTLTLTSTGTLNLLNTINSTAFTVGSTFTANATVVNSAAFNVGTTFTANATLTNTVALAVVSNTFTLGTSQTQANNGYTRLPNGMLMQWGNVLANASAGNVTFPTPFTTIYQSQVTSGLTGFYGFIAGSNTTVIQCRSSQAVAATNLVSWQAIGV